MAVECPFLYEAVGLLSLVDGANRVARLSCQLKHET